MWSWGWCCPPCRTDPSQPRTAPLRAPHSPRPVSSSLPHWVQIALPLWDRGQLPAAGWLRCPPRRDITLVPKSQLPPPLPGLEWKLEGQWRDSEESLWLLRAQLAWGEEYGERFQCCLPPSGPLRGPPFCRQGRDSPLKVMSSQVKIWAHFPTSGPPVAKRRKSLPPHLTPARPATPGKIITPR